MGRKKIAIVKLESEAQRNVTYKIRSRGLIKKACEISVLSDVNVSLIMFSTTGKLDSFSSQPGMWKMLQRFMQNIPDNERRLISEDNMDKINVLAQQHELADRQLNNAIMDEETRNKLLEVKNRLMDPSREAFKSQQQFAGLLQSLENIRQTVANRRMPMQQELEAENGVPEQVQEQMQHPAVENLGVRNPSPSSNSAQNIEPNATASPFIEGHQKWRLEDIMDPQILLPVKTQPVSNDHLPEFISHPIPEEYQQQNMLQGMDFSGGVETAYRQPSASYWDMIFNAAEPDSTTATAQENPEAFNKDQAGDDALIFAPHSHMPMQQYQGMEEFGMGNLSSASVPLSRMPKQLTMNNSR